MEECNASGKRTGGGGQVEAKRHSGNVGVNIPWDDNATLASPTSRQPCNATAIPPAHPPYIHHLLVLV